MKTKASKEKETLAVNIDKKISYKNELAYYGK
jgi:hypothetical protein